MKLPMKLKNCMRKAFWPLFIASAVIVGVFVSFRIGYASSNWGEYPIIDWSSHALFMLLFVGLIIWAFKEYRLDSPPAKPLVILMLVYAGIGIVFSGIYSTIYYFDSKAFSGLMTGDKYEFIYFSFVTMTTLGYGDIRPVTPLPRLLTIFQACLGLYFIAILVATVLKKKTTER